MGELDPNTLTDEQKRTATPLPVVSASEAARIQKNGMSTRAGMPLPTDNGSVLIDNEAPKDDFYGPSLGGSHGAPPPAPFTIANMDQRNALLAHLKSGNLPSDIAKDTAVAIKDFDAKQATNMDAARAADRSGASDLGNDSETALLTSNLVANLGPEVGLRTLENLGQVGLNSLNLVTGVAGMRDSLINPINNEKVSDFNAGVTQRRKEWSDDMHAKYGDVPMSAAADLSAGVLAAPLFMSRTGVLLKDAQVGLQGEKLLPTLGSEMTRNALYSASEFDPKAKSLLDKTGTMTAGALFPLAVTAGGFGLDVAKSLSTLGNTAGTGLVSQGIKNMFVRAVLRRSDPESVRAADQAGEFFKSVGVTPTNEAPLSLGQISGDPRLISYENRFTDVRTRDYAKTQNNDLLQGVQALRDQLNQKAGGTGPNGVGAGVYNAINEADGNLRILRNTDWEAGRKNVADVAAAARAANGGAPITFPITNTLGTINAVVKDLDNPAAMADPSIKARLQNLQSLLQDAQTKGGKFTPQGLMGMLEGLNAGKTYGGAAAGGAPGGADAALEAIRSKVMDAIYADAAAGGQQAQPVAAAIADMRQRYAFQSDALRKLQDDTMNKLFGDKETLANSAAAVDKFLALDPSAQRYGVQLLRERAPQVLYGMQSRMIENAINAAMDAAKPAMSGQFDPIAFSNSLYGNGAVRSGVMTSDTLKQIESAKGYITGILNNKNSITRPGTQVWPEDIAINIISQSPEFMARAVTRVMTGLNAEKLFVTPEGINAMRIVSNLRNVPKESAVAAATYLGTLMQDSSAREQAAQNMHERAKAPLGSGGGRYGVGAPVQNGQ